jgi:hypothetical protein
MSNDVRLFASRRRRKQEVLHLRREAVTLPSFADGCLCNYVCGDFAEIAIATALFR